MKRNIKEKNINKKEFKHFLYKLISISIAIVIVFNLLFNLIFAERLEKIDMLLSLDKNNIRSKFSNKIRNELKKGLEKDNIFYEDDKILIYKLYKKIVNEFNELEKENLK
tara:strand:+ start:242 stop:571 length:330 start_codon:yes stop_codon:yes gene_type:complete